MLSWQQLQAKKAELRAPRVSGLVWVVTRKQTTHHHGCLAVLLCVLAGAACLLVCLLPAACRLVDCCYPGMLLSLPTDSPALPARQQRQSRAAPLAEAATSQCVGPLAVPHTAVHTHFPPFAFLPNPRRLDR